jgi:hypothetical protein
MEDPGAVGRLGGEDVRSLHEVADVSRPRAALIASGAKSRNRLLWPVLRSQPGPSRAGRRLFSDSVLRYDKTRS